METINKVILRGTIGCCRTSQVQDKAMARFSICTNFAYKGKDGIPVIETQWTTVVAFEGKKNPVRELTQGKRVEVHGRLRNQHYVCEDGIDRYYTEVLANEIELLDDEQE